MIEGEEYLVWSYFIGCVIGSKLVIFGRFRVFICKVEGYRFVYLINIKYLLDIRYCFILGNIVADIDIIFVFIFNKYIKYVKE